MKVEFKYLSKPRTVTLPDQTRILDTEAFELVPDTYIEIIKSLLRPWGYNRSLFDMAKSADNACVAIDAMIPTSILDMVLRPVLKTLHAAGLAYNDICILFAAEYPLEVKKSLVRSRVSKDIRDLYHIEVHDNFTLTHHQLTGNTSRNTPVYVDRRFLQANMKIAIGRVIPHFAAGLFDAMGVVGLGLTSPDTLRSLYGLAGQDSDRDHFFDTAMHNEIIELCKLAQVDVIVNILMSTRNRVMNIFSGAVEETCKATESILLSDYTETLQAPADAVVATSGFAGVESWYMLVETVCNAAAMVKQNGSIVLISDLLLQLDNKKILDCESSEDFLSLFLDEKRWLGIFEILEKKLNHKTIYFPAGAKKNIRSKSNAGPRLCFTSSIRSAIMHIEKEYGTNYSCLALPEGISTFVKPL